MVWMVSFGVAGVAVVAVVVGAVWFHLVSFGFIWRHCQFDMWKQAQGAKVPRCAGVHAQVGYNSYLLQEREL